VVMSLLVDKEAIGWYATADVLFGSLLFVPVILMTSLFPAIADLYSRDPDEVNRMLQRTFRSLLLVAVPIGLATIVVAKPFVDLLYGEKFAETAQVLQIYGAVVVLSCMTILLGRFALATGKVKFWTVLMVLSIFASIPLDLVLVPFTDHRYHNGAMGGALAYVFTESFMLVVGVIKLSPGLFDSETAKRILRCAIAGAMMLAASWPLRTHFFLVPGIVSLVVYGVAMLLMRTLNEDERRMVNRFTEAARRLSGRRKRAA
jgi:O-antigen/teichoic acid export membrane protein